MAMGEPEGSSIEDDELETGRKCDFAKRRK